MIDSASMVAEWTRHDDDGPAADELLDAAGRAFAELGVAKTTMVDVCRYAGCARSTLYRYFENRHALRLAYLNRSALRISRRVAAAHPAAAEPSAVLADRILGSVEAVRSDPMLAMWFTPENMAVPIALSHDSDVIAAIASGFTTGLPGFSWSAAELARRGQWMVRSVVSLLAMPMRDRAEERAWVEDLVVPALVDARPGRKS